MQKLGNDSVNEKYGSKSKWYYILDIDSFIMHIQTDDLYQDFAKDIEKRFHTSNHEVESILELSKGKMVQWKKNWVE